jgi:Domain of unknown function (DUF4386)
MQPSTPALERPLLRMGSVAFLAGLVVTIVSTLFHVSTEDLMDNPSVFVAYAESDTWIAAHIGQFAGVMLIFAGGFVALFRLLARSEAAGIASALAWLGLVIAVVTASTFAILQAVDGIALKRAVDTWYAAADGEEEKAIAFRVAEGTRWIEIGINSINRILQGAATVIFGVAIAKSTLLNRGIGVFGVFAGASTIIAGISVAYVGFSSSQAVLGDVSTVTSFAWIAILGIFMWRKTMAKKMISR